MNKPNNVINQVSAELEGVSAQIMTLLFIAKPAARTETEILNQRMFENYVAGLANHVDRLAADLDNLNNED